MSSQVQVTPTRISVPASATEQRLVTSFGDTVYYGSSSVTSSSYTGTLTDGQSVKISDVTWFVTAADVGRKVPGGARLSVIEHDVSATGPTTVVAHVPTDADFSYTPPNGAQALDSSTGIEYVRIAGVWTPVSAGATSTVAGATDVDDTTAVIDGNVLYYDGASGKFKGVAPALNLINAKGDLIGATGQDAPVRVAVGTNGQVLTADSTQTPGIKWATPSALSLTWPSYAVGDYVTTPASATQNSALTDGRLDVAPLYVGKPFNIDQLSIRVITGVGATVIRLGIWNDNGAGRPGTLLAEASSTVDSSSSGGKTANLASALTLASGVYWLGAQAEGGGPTVVCCSNISAFAPASSPTSLGVNGWRTTHTGAFGSLVAASWSLIGGNAAPVVTARVSA